MKGKRRAFVVGIDQYKEFSEDQQLQNAVSDAKAVSSMFMDIGFDDVSYYENMDRSGFTHCWQRFVENIGRNDVVVFYFSGHGVEIDRQNYLLPQDMPYIRQGRAIQIRGESISVANILDDIDECNPSVAILILDSCRDDPLISNEYKKSLGVNTKGGLAKPEIETEGRFIMYSAAAGQIAYDRLPNDACENSVYTRHLLELAPRPNLGIYDLALDLRDKVSNSTGNAFGRTNSQRPSFYGDIDRNFCLVNLMGASGIDENKTMALKSDILRKEILEKVEKEKAEKEKAEKEKAEKEKAEKEKAEKEKAEKEKAEKEKAEKEKVEKEKVEKEKVEKEKEKVELAKEWQRKEWQRKSELDQINRANRAREDEILDIRNRKKLSKVEVKLKKAELEKAKREKAKREKQKSEKVVRKEAVRENKKDRSDSKSFMTYLGHICLSIAYHIPMLFILGFMFFNCCSDINVQGSDLVIILISSIIYLNIKLLRKDSHKSKHVFAILYMVFGALGIVTVLVTLHSIRGA